MLLVTKFFLFSLLTVGSLVSAQDSFPPIKASSITDGLIVPNDALTINFFGKRAALICTRSYDGMIYFSASSKRTVFSQDLLFFGVSNFKLDHITKLNINGNPHEFEINVDLNGGREKFKFKFANGSNSVSENDDVLTLFLDKEIQLDKYSSFSKTMKWYYEKGAQCILDVVK